MATIHPLTSSKPPKLPFPRLTADSESPLFWLACWLRDQAALEALQALAYSKAIDTTRKPALFHALCQGMHVCKETANTSLRFLVDTGGLPMAWHGTTALDAAGVPA